MNLSNNFIQKIQNLQLLVKLQELDLSHNQIKMLDGLEALLNLEKLNVSHNQISTIPSWFGKKLLALNVLIMSSNNIKKVMYVTITLRDIFIDYKQILLDPLFLVIVCMYIEKLICCSRLMKPQNCHHYQT